MPRYRDVLRWCRSASDSTPLTLTTPQRGHPSAGSAKKANYEIGYGKPPRATQFKKGRSWNPKGAKKKEQIEDVRMMVEDVLAEPATLRDGDKVVPI